MDAPEYFHDAKEALKEVEKSPGRKYFGRRGRENEARKVALYWVKRCCDRTLPEVAEYSEWVTIRP